MDTRNVQAIKDGTVIDHLPVGLALPIIQLFRFAQSGERVTLGLNLHSQQLQKKDIFKVENVALSAEQANQLALFAPQATVNVIRNFEVVQKYVLTLPTALVGVFACPNQNCISHKEPVESHFAVLQTAKAVTLTCHFCEKTYPRVAFPL